MPTVLTPQGWVKVAPAPRKKKPVNHNPAQALKGPLAYFSCQPIPAAKKELGNELEYPYDLTASPMKLQQQAQGQSPAKIGSKSRTVSAPQPALCGGPDIDSDDEVDRKSNPTLSSARSISPPPKSSRSHRSYKRHRPVEAIAPSVTVYHTPPAPQLQGPRHPHGMGHDHYYYPTGGSALPFPPTSARSMSYSWYNATTPLNL